MQLSDQQKAIVEAVARNDSDIQVTARAGTGKTTVILQACAVAQGSVAFFAFNKEIADELKRRAPHGVNVQTFHSLGFAAIRRALGKVEVDVDRAFNLLCRTLDRESPEDRAVLPAAKKLLGLCKNLLCATDDDTLAEVCIAYDIELERYSTAKTFHAVRQALVDSIPNPIAGPVTIDFDDMVYLPIAMRLTMPKYDWTFADESQDVNAVQIALIESVIDNGGRLCFVGDEKQAIYGFRGSDENAMSNIRKHLESLGRTVVNYPLTITRRCPVNVVKVANHYVPDIEAAPGAPGGTVAQVDAIEPRVGDMVLCRANAPLVKIAYDLIRQEIPVVIRGRDIGAGLAALVRKLRVNTIDELHRALDAYSRKEANIIASRFAQKPWKCAAALEALADKVETLGFIASDQATVDGVLNFIARVFADDTKDRARIVLLSSVHKAKGLESGTVWIQEFRPLPGPQENNILYVAITRAKDRLFIAPHAYAALDHKGNPMADIPIHLAGPPEPRRSALLEVE